MKKFVIVTISICMLAGIWGCGKNETEMVEKKIVPAEKSQTEIKLPEEKHEFIKNEQGFIVHMKDIKVLLKHLSVSINQQDWEAIKQDT
ncbi:MAG: hypothetical protein Q6358_01960, partial [Candidatus Brocadiales bacterium]|nr:hypothetical protein [Candidatus Brocadiales bacterium]